MDSIAFEPLFVILIGDQDHNVHVGCRSFESVRDGAAEQKCKHFGITLKIFSDVLDGLGVMWVHDANTFPLKV